jgi:CRP/FNR family transcriptional regulator, cyclic AMP receptor protein
MVLRNKDAGGAPPRYPRLLDKIDEADRHQLLARARPWRLTAGALIFSQSAPIDDVFIIQEGRVKAYYTTAQGQSITFAYWHAGMLMGVPGLSSDFNHMWSAEAMADTVLMQLPRSDLVGLISRSVTAAKAMIEILEFKSKYLSTLVQVLATASVADRLLIVLRNLGDLYGVTDDAGTRIDLPLTHAEIADMVGASRQWVTVTLGKLEDAGALSTRGRRIILRRDRLLTVPAGLSG